MGFFFCLLLHFYGRGGNKSHVIVQLCTDESESNESLFYSLLKKMLNVACTHMMKVLFNMKKLEDEYSSRHV